LFKIYALSALKFW